MKRLLLVLISITTFQFLFAQWSTNGTSVYYNSGNIGIGTSSPSSPWSKVLQVYDYNNAALSIKTPVRDWQLVTDATGGFWVYDVTGGVCRLYITSSGNVGIGTTSPRKNFETVGVGMFSASSSGSGIILDGSQLSTTNTFSSVQLTAGDVGGGSAYLKSSLYNWGGYFSWTRGSASGDVEVMRINATNGNVGIGTTNPTQILHLFNPSSSTYLNIDKINGAEAGIVFSKNTAPLFYLWSDNADDDALKIEVSGLPGEHDGAPRMMFPKTNKNIYMAQSGGSVGIGTTSVNDVNYKLFVETGIRTRKIKVDQSTWSDYVFSSSYKLPTLKEVEEFVKQYRHLPDVPSAQEVKKNGIDLGDNQATLLKKIEELTLYIIDQDKKNELQQKEINDLKTQNKELEEIKKELETIKTKLAK